MPKTVAIIGGGAAGLATLYELLYTSKDGTSSVGGDLPINPGFDPTLFEQNSQVGGVWNASLEETDPPLPPTDTIQSETYDDPFALQPASVIPEELNHLNSLELNTTQFANQNWSKSPVYENLYTNIPKRSMRFTYTDQYTADVPHLSPFLYHNNIQDYLVQFVRTYNLQSHIELNTQVESAKFSKETAKWTIVTRTFNGNTQKDLWKKNEYDYLVIAAGHYNVPYIPKIKGFSQYVEKFPTVVEHAKAFRRAEEFIDKTVLIVGSNVSSIDIIQYIFKFAKKIYISRKSKEARIEWFDRVLKSEGLTIVDKIESLDSTDGSVKLVDGTVLTHIDKIVFATGYHFHTPFLEKSVVSLSARPEDAGSALKLNDVYLHTFDLNNPQLAFVGVQVTPVLWHSIEAQAAAIAGVWSGYNKLPSSEDQEKWLSDRLKHTNNSVLFQTYRPPEEIIPWLITPLATLFPKNRLNPFDVEKDTIEEVKSTRQKIEDLFYSYKSGVYR